MSLKDGTVTLMQYCDELPFYITNVNEDYFIQPGQNFVDKNIQKEKQERHIAFIRMIKDLCLVYRTIDNYKVRAITVYQILNMLSTHYDKPYDIFFRTRGPVPKDIRTAKRMVMFEILRATDANFSLWSDMVVGRNLFSTPPFEVIEFFQNKIMFNKIADLWLDSPKPEFNLDKAMNIIFEHDKELIGKLVDNDEKFYLLLARMEAPFDYSF